MKDTRHIRMMAAALAVAIMLPSVAPGQIVKKAQVGLRFLENPVSAEVVGQGGVGILTTRDANGIFWNPALLGLVSHTVDLTLNRTQGIADINYNALAAAVRLGDFGVVGFSFLSMDYGTFYGTRRDANPAGYVETGEFSPKAFAAGVAFSQAVSDRFSYGVHLKYVYQNLGSAWVAPFGTSIDSDPNLPISQREYNLADHGTPLAVDVGACYDFRSSGIRFAAALQNISREFHYESDDFPMPFAVSFGATIEPLQFFYDGEQGSALLLSFQSRHPRDFKERLNIGAEYKVMPSIVVRVGEMINYDERGFTAGVGLAYDLSGVNTRFDYAYQAYGLFGAVHYISLGFGL